MLLATESTLLVGYGTHPGEIRQQNEDSCAIHFLRTTSGVPVVLAIVADGTGRDSHRASEFVIQTIAEFIQQSSSENYRFILEEAILQAAFYMGTRATSDLDFSKIVVTCTVVLVVGFHRYAAYVGDNNLYLLNKEHIRQITTNHNSPTMWVIDPNLASGFGLSPANLRCISAFPEWAQPDFRLSLSDDETSEQAEANQGFRLAYDDMVLICSDGLWGLLKELDIVDVILSASHPQVAVNNLIALARQRGGYDNITAIILQVPPGTHAL